MRCTECGQFYEEEDIDGPIKCRCYKCKIKHEEEYPLGAFIISNCYKSLGHLVEIYGEDNVRWCIKKKFSSI